MKKLLLLVVAASVLGLHPTPSHATTLDISDNLDNVVYIECGSYVNDVWTPVIGGSGVVLDSATIITNAHVVADTTTGYYYDKCRGGVSTSSFQAPTLSFDLNPVYGKYDQYFDYALLEPTNVFGGILNLDSHVSLANADSLVLNDYVYVLGFPGTGGNTITATEGAVAGFLGTNWIKSDVNIEHGNSGGGAFDSLGNFFGIPTGVATGEINNLAYIQNINAITEDLAGSAIAVRDYDTLYTTANVFCLDGACYHFADDEIDHPDIFDQVNDDQEQQLADDNQTATIDDTTTITTDDTPTQETTEEPVIEDTPEVTVHLPPESSHYQPERYDASLQSRLKGNILLEVEQHGEAWYVNPNDSLRYYMPDGASAYSMMRSFSLGITDADLATLPSVENTDGINAASSICSKNSLANRLRGYILLQVQQHGEAWYVDPDTCYRIYMKDGDVAYEIMRYLSLGITDADLQRLPSGEIE